MKSLYESILKSTNIGRCNFEVDLGLSVNWCAYNVGATKPEEYGLYFAWGDTRGYKESEMGKNTFTLKWYKNLHASKIQGDLKLKEDAANKYFKGKWHIPSLEDIKELKANTKQTIEVLNGIEGMRFTAKNGNSIFIPFAGFAGTGIVEYDNIGFYCWTSSRDEDSAYVFGGAYAGVNENPCDTSYGLSIRAVCDK